MRKYSIELKPKQRHELEQRCVQGQPRRARYCTPRCCSKAIREAGGPRWSDRQIHATFGISDSTMKRIRQRFVQGGLTEALRRHKQPERPQKRKLNGEQEAQLILLACSQAPEGQERWTMQLLRSGCSLSRSWPDQR